MNTTQFFTSPNGKVELIKADIDSLQPALAPAVYEARYDEGVYYLQYVSELDYQVPAKRYGSIDARADKVLSTFNSSDSCLGVKATGLKGAGKSGLMKLICYKAQLPVIKISKPFFGPAFNQFLQDLGTCVIFFDEFEKVYNDNTQVESDDGGSAYNPQDTLLNLFDGAVPGKRLHLVTANRDRDINNFMRGRLGRFLYNFKYDKLEAEVIAGYAKDNKLPKKVRKELLDISHTIPEFSFDVLQGICAEYLRYKQPIKELIADLDVEIKVSTDKLKINEIVFKASLKDKECQLKSAIIDDFSITQDFRVLYTALRDVNDKTNRYEDNVYVDNTDLVYNDGTNYIYENKWVKFSGTIIKDEIDFSKFKAF